MRDQVPHDPTYSRSAPAPLASSPSLLANMTQEPPPPADALRVEEENKRGEEGERDEDESSYDDDDDYSDGDSEANLNEYIDNDDEDDDDDDSQRTATRRRRANDKQRLAIVGSGWAGYTLAASLDPCKFAVTVVSPAPALVYTPLLAGAATAQLAPRLAEAAPVRASRTKKNKKRRGGSLRYVQARVVDIDFARRQLRCEPAFDDGDENNRREQLEGRQGQEGGKGAEDVFDEPFDLLAFAPGCTPDLLNGAGAATVPGLRQHAFFLRTAEDARRLRSRLFAMLEKASTLASIAPSSDAASNKIGDDEQQQQQLLVLQNRIRDVLRVVIMTNGSGAGGTVGIELAAALRDFARRRVELRKLFPAAVVDKMSVVVHDVVESAQQPQRGGSTFERELFEFARERVEELERKEGGGEGAGAAVVQVRAGSRVVRVERDAVVTQEEGRLPCGMVVWATGNASVPLVERLEAKRSPEGAGVVRVLTDSRLRVLKPKRVGELGGVGSSAGGGYDEDEVVWEDVYGLGDACEIEGTPLPPTAEVAVQKARYLASVLNSGSEAPYRFRPKGLAAYLGGNDGIIRNNEWTGKLAWVSWRQGCLTWTKSFKTKSMIFLTWGIDRLFGTELARL